MVRARCTQRQQCSLTPDRVASLTSTGFPANRGEEYERSLVGAEEDQGIHEKEDGNNSRKVLRGNWILVQSARVSVLHSDRQKTEGGKEGEREHKNMRREQRWMAGAKRRHQLMCEPVYFRRTLFATTGNVQLSHVC